MRNKLFTMATFLTLLALSQPVNAQSKKNERTIALWGHVKDSFTKGGIPGTKITLMSSDSIVLDTTTVFSGYGDVTHNSDYMYRFSQPAVPAKFIIKAEHPDYETAYVDYDVKYVKRNTYFDAPHHYMKRKVYHTNMDAYLDEVVVKASKVKLVHKKDTLVFDATAFNLPDGSMLDALIRQMPGVTLSDDGVITVNGRKVDYLLLNGKDFFKGNNKVVLDNLPYYTVRDIKVYDRQTDLSAYMGRDVEEKEHVMDINLKREYRKSYMANAEAGLATSDRYLGRGAGIRITDNSAIMAYLNLNNINESRKPGSTGEWSPTNMPEGRQTTKDVGVNITVDDKEKRFKENLTVNGNILDVSRAQNSRSTNFNSAMTSYNLSDSHSDSRQRNFKLNNTFQLRLPFLMYVLTNVSVGDNESMSQSRSAYMNSDMYEYDDNVEALDTIFSPTLQGDKRKRIVNRSIQTSRGNSDNVNLSQRVILNHKLPWGDNLGLEIGALYNKNSAEDYRDYRLDYFSSPQIADYRNQLNTHPTERYSWDVRANYYINLPSNWTWRFNTQFVQGNNKDDNRVYRLDWADQALSPDESVYSNDFYRISQNEVSATYSRRTNNYYRNVQISLPFSFRNDKFHYSRAGKDLHISRDEKYVNGSVTSSFSWDEWRRSLNVRFWHTTELPDLMEEVALPDDRNPLAVRIGNPNLKNSHRFRSSVIYNYTFKNRRWMPWGQIDVLWKINPIVSSFNYDRNTGVYTYSSVNGDKYINTWFVGGVNGHLDRNQRWYLSYKGELQRNWTETAEMNSDGTGSKLYGLNMTNSVHNLLLRYSKGKFNTSIRGRITTNNIKYDTPLRNSYNRHVFDLNHNVQYTVPVLDLQLASQLSWYYVNNDQKGMPNQSNVIWNVYASRSLLKDKSLILKFSAFDILGDLNQQTSYVGDNSLSLTNTQRLNQYFMLSLSWQFNKAGKQ